MLTEDVSAIYVHLHTFFSKIMYTDVCVAKNYLLFYFTTNYKPLIYSQEFRNYVICMWRKYLQITKNPVNMLLFKFYSMFSSDLFSTFGP
jgi:hypothetical protein